MQCVCWHLKDHDYESRLIWKIFSTALRLSVLPWCIPKRLQACDLLLRMIGKIQVSCDRFRCVFVVFTSPSCFPNRTPKWSNFCASVLLFAKSASYAVDGIQWLRYKWTDQWSYGSFGSRYFCSVTNERTCLATWARTSKTWGLLSCLDCTAELKVTYLFVAFKWN